MITLSIIRSRLADALTHCGMTQTAIAKALKISQSNISHYIDGSKTPSLVNFAKLCELLDLDIEYILGIKN